MANTTYSYVVHLVIQATVVLLLALFSQGSSLDATALLRWKETLPYQRILDSWAFQAQNQSPCSWRGISCDSQGSVVVINLAYTELQGTLENLDFTAFPNLQRLDLKVNNLTGIIPQNSG
ncbi:hypothetical protein PIB30_075198, partial [Stylosanthes scabra]|nr:hypothetical protein [Stylosanthes scabra]